MMSAWKLWAVDEKNFQTSDSHFTASLISFSIPRLIYFAIYFEIKSFVEISEAMLNKGEN